MRVPISRVINQSKSQQKDQLTALNKGNYMKTIQQYLITPT